MNLISFLSAVLLIATFSPISMASEICDKSLKMRDDIFKGVKYQSKCDLTWTDNGKSMGLLYYTVPDKCEYEDGTPLETCGFVQTCTNDEEKFEFSPGIFFTKDFAKKYCGDPNSRVTLLGFDDSDPKVNYKVFLECKDGQPKQVILQSPDGTQKNCPLKEKK